MAIVTGNPILQGFSGVLGGNLVFRQYGDKTIVSVKREPRRQKKSALQQLYLDNFKEASRYARQLLRDPNTLDHYRKLAKKQGKHSAYNLVISEYIKRVRISMEGGTGFVKKDAKRVKFCVDKGKYRVNDVSVTVCRQGNVIGEGRVNRGSGNIWVYAVGENLEVGDVFCVRAVDRFGTVAVSDFVVRE